MNRNFTKAICFAIFACIPFTNAIAQTITFTQDDPTHWADGIAEDGDGGSTNIAGITLQMYAANTSFNPITSTIEWKDNTWLYTADATYTAITAMTSVTPPATPGLVPAFVIKSSSQSVNFSLSSIKMYDWGGSNGQKMEAFDNGVSKGFITLSFNNVVYVPMTLAQPTSLPTAIFSNIDEIRFSAANPVDGMFLSFNDLTIGSIPLPLHILNFDAQLNKDNSAQLVWNVTNEADIASYVVEQSSDAVNFKTIGEVAANSKTNAGIGDYHFSTQKISGTSFFRIKQLDKNGASFYSKIAAVSVNARSNSFAVYPNPTFNTMNVVGLKKMNSITILNLEGKIIQQYHPNETHALIDLSILSAGIYQMIIDADGTQQKQQITKQ